MAWAAKRSLEYDPFNQQAAKRRCYDPFDQHGANYRCYGYNSFGKHSVLHETPCVPATTALNCESSINERLIVNEPRIAAVNETNQLIENSFNGTGGFKNLQQVQGDHIKLNESNRLNQLNWQSESVKKPEKSLFTFQQVEMICEPILKKREDYLKEHFDAALNAKLAEQYESFVKFTYDQIQKRYKTTPSYVS